MRWLGKRNKPRPGDAGPAQQPPVPPAAPGPQSAVVGGRPETATFATARPHLSARPVGLVANSLRARQIAAELPGRADPGADADACRPVAADLAIGVVLDLPDVDLPVLGSTLHSWGVDFDTVLDAARGNPQDQVQLSQGPGFTVLVGRAFLAELLYRPELAAAFSFETPVLIVPDQHHGVLFDAADPAAALNRLTSLQLETDRPLSHAALRPVGDRWTPYAWPTEQAEVVRRLRLGWEIRMYPRAREILQLHLDESSYVATFTAGQNAAGELTTVTDLQETPSADDPVTVIPRCEEVVVAASDGRRATVAFADLEARGDVLAPLEGIEPVFFRVLRFPHEVLGAG